MADHDRQKDRYFAGELSSPEQRQLAYAALDDADLFDALTEAALVKAALLRSPGPIRQTSADPGRPEVLPTGRAATVRRFKRTGIMVAAGGLAAAAAVTIMIRAPRSPGPAVPSASPPSASVSSGGSVPAPAIAAPAVILSARLDDRAASATAEFRTTGAASRPPNPQGEVVSVDEGEAAVNLGALDGLVKGVRLQVVAPDDGARRRGELTIGAVFRERARGRATSGRAEVGDRVQVPPAVHVTALLEQVDARIAAGNSAEALALAGRAAAIAAPPGVPANLRRRAFDRLGTLEHRHGALPDAAQHLQLAVDALDQAPAATPGERGRLLNELGAVLIERGEDVQAEQVLRLALPHATGADAAHVANNLAALAARRGDRPAADALYSSALALIGDSPGLAADRRAIESNRAALKGSR